MPSGGAAAAPDAAEAVCSEEHVLVRLRPGVDPVAWAESRGHALDHPTASGTCRVRLAPTRLGAQKAAKAFTADPDVAWSEPDWRVAPLGTSDDARLAQQWNLRAVGAFEAWDVTRGDPGIVVGVLDSGILAHADVAGQSVPGYDFVSDESLAADGDGRDADPSDPGDTDASNGFSLWHGTHVAALVAGRADDGFGVAGLAPACRVMPLRVLGRRGGLVSDVADALLYACGQHTTRDGQRLTTPLRVVNLSLGTSSYSAELEAACATAAGLGVLMVAATGNSGGAVLYPAAFPTVLAVGAADAVLRGASYSNRGPEVSLCAPGGLSLQDTDGDGWPDAVLSAARDETVYPAVDAHTWQAGTSEACPHVAAAAALLLAVDPTLSRIELRDRLEQSALDLGLAGRDDLHGWGLLQVHTALKRLQADLGGLPLGAPRLHLPMPGLRFIGLESLKRIPLVNAGGGVLALLGAQAVTDDGGDWLGASFVPSFLGADITASHLEVLVDRSRLPAGEAWTSGTLRLYSLDGSLGLVRVVVAGNNVWPRAGTTLRVVPIDVDDGGAPTITTAHPEHDYRYVLGRLPAGTYHVRAGEDLDADGFSCEPFDICGWYGGETQETALPLEYVAGSILEGIDFTIGLVPPP
jgi:serine protease